LRATKGIEGMDVLLQATPDFLYGALHTIIYCAVSFPIALLLGLVLALMSGSRFVWLRGPARIFIEVVRSTPMITQLFLIYFGLSAILATINIAQIDNPWTAGIASLALNYCAYEAEVFRAGFLSVDRGQSEAALSLGLTSRQSFFRVVLPQAVPLMIPPFVNDLIYMLKDSAIISVIGGTELTAALELAREYNYTHTLALFAYAMALYLVMSLPTSYFARWYERRLRAAL